MWAARERVVAAEILLSSQTMDLAGLRVSSTLEVTGLSESRCWTPSVIAQNRLPC